MSIRFVKGDLFCHENLRVLAHGCNCAGAMGKGIAVEFRSRFPLMYEEYKKRCVEGRFRLGDVFYWEEAGWVVFNLGTQKAWRVKADLSSIDASVRAMAGLAERKGLSARPNPPWPEQKHQWKTNQPLPSTPSAYQD